MSDNGITLFENNKYFTAFPDPASVFASDVEKHLQYFLPVASVELSKINPEWEDTVHFIVPIEPADGVVGGTTQEFYTHYSRNNWIGFQNNGGRSEFEGDWRLFVRDSIQDYYQAALHGFDVAKKHFEKYKALHTMSSSPNDSGELFDFDRPRALVEQLGGECYDNNWANMGNFNITRFGSWVEIIDGEREEDEKVRPVTEDGRPFEYIGFINAGTYNMNSETDYTWAETLLFYDPITKISLVTFDWT